MSAEFVVTGKIFEIEQYVSNFEHSPEYGDVVLALPSFRRVINLRGHLIGEGRGDVADVLFDINSYQQLNWDEDKLKTVLGSLITLETMYYRYAEN